MSKTQYSHFADYKVGTRPSWTFLVFWRPLPKRSTWDEKVSLRYQLWEEIELFQRAVLFICLKNRDLFHLWTFLNFHEEKISINDTVLESPLHQLGISGLMGKCSANSLMVLSLCGFEPPPSQFIFTFFYLLHLEWFD